MHRLLFNHAIVAPGILNGSKRGEYPKGLMILGPSEMQSLRYGSNDPALRMTTTTAWEAGRLVIGSVEGRKKAVGRIVIGEWKVKTGKRRAGETA